jgi:hypothetical protein
MARNRKLLKDMDLNQVTNLLGMKCPKGGRGGGKASSRKKVKKGMEDEWSSESNSADDNDGSSSDEEENQDGPTREQMPPTTRARAARGAGTAKGGAKWAETAWSILLEVEMGVDWKDVVSLWWTLEELWKFATSVSGGEPWDEIAADRLQTDQVPRDDASAESSGRVGQKCAQREPGHRVGVGHGAGVVGMVEEYQSGMEDEGWRTAARGRRQLGCVEMPGSKRVSQHHCVLEMVALLHGDTVRRVDVCRRGCEVGAGEND